MPGDNTPKRIDYMVQVWREGAHYVAHAMPLDVVSAGDSSDDARRALDEAVQLFLTTARDHGTLSEVLLEAGYSEIDGGWQAPDWIGVESHSGTLPA